MAALAAAAFGLLSSNLALAQCGSGGSCFTAHGPGCNVADCCGAVCAVDFFCCSNQWDGICVGEANDFCVSAPVAGPFTNPANGNQYYILDPGTWQTLQAASVALGGHLVTIHSAAEDLWVTNTVHGAGFPADFFIGLSDKAVEGQFVWVDNTVLNVAFWTPGQPDNGGGIEDVVQIWSIAGEWNDLPVTAVRLGVAEVEVPVCGEPEAGSCFAPHGPYCDDAGCCEAVCAFDAFCCNNFWDQLCVNEANAGCLTSPTTASMIDPTTGRRLTLWTPGYWLAAEGKAEALGQRLVTVEDGRGNEFARRWLLNAVPGFGPGDAWIGASDIDVEGSFAWESGAPFGFQRWAPSQPDNVNNEDVVAMSPAKGEWNDARVTVVQRAVTESGFDACGSGGDCFALHVAAGCSLEGCCQAVCAMDGFCCANHWDGVCVNEANLLCDPPVVRGPMVNPANGHTYYGLAGATWSEAERVAMTFGGHIAVPNTLAENIWILANFVQGSGALGTSYIGLHDQLKEGTFQGLDTAAPIAFAAWSAGEPNNAGNEDVAVLGTSGLWNDVSMQGTAPAVIEVPCIGDINASRQVDAADLAILLGAWGRNPGPSDLNLDGEVDAADLALLLGGWGACDTSDCCTANGGHGCDQPGCTACVCSLDPFCCQTHWDLNCASEAANDCNSACQCGG